MFGWPTWAIVRKSKQWKLREMNKHVFDFEHSRLLLSLSVIINPKNENFVRIEIQTMILIFLFFNYIFFFLINQFFFFLQIRRRDDRLRFLSHLNYFMNFFFTFIIYVKLFFTVFVLLVYSLYNYKDSIHIIIIITWCLPYFSRRIYIK